MAISDVIFGSRFLCRKKGYTNSKLKVIVEYTKYGSQLKKPLRDRYCLPSFQIGTKMMQIVCLTGERGLVVWQISVFTALQAGLEM